MRPLPLFLSLLSVPDRLGVFGYLGAEELRGRVADRSTGHYGQRDQRLALKWVKSNIEAFGGDPDRVLLMGESSGAGSVSCHLVAKASFGLAKRFAFSSGAFGTWLTTDMPDAQATFDQLVKVGRRPTNYVLSKFMHPSRTLSPTAATTETTATIAITLPTVACRIRKAPLSRSELRVQNGWHLARWLAG